VTRLDQRQGFLISSVVHMVILTVLWSNPPTVSKVPIPVQPPEPPRIRQKVFLPPASVLRQFQASPPPAARPRVEPTPPPQEAKAKDRISVGPPSDERSKKPLILRREDDLTAVPKGRPDAAPSPQESTAPVAQATPSAGGASPSASAPPGLRLPPGLEGRTPQGDEGRVPRPGASAPSIASSLRDLERRLQVEGPRGQTTGTVKQMGPLAFDPEGADFTLWVNHFKNEVYRNWIPPQPALFGMRGHVDFEFTVERDGTMRDLRMLKSSGTPAMDRAAQNALLASRLLPLPADFGPQRVQMQITFFYNEGPQGT
jgi:TonB family protein